MEVITNWERVLYLNAWATCILVTYEFLFDLRAVMHLHKHLRNTGTFSCVIISCVMAVIMSYLTMACRKAISATAFTVVGNVCKVMTIVASAVIWGQHVTAYGMASLLACLVAATFYEQAPLVSEQKASLLPTA